MAAIVLVTCGLCAASAAWAASGLTCARTGARDGRMATRARAWRSACMRWLKAAILWLSSSRMVALCMRRPPFMRATQDVERKMASRGERPPRAVAAAWLAVCIGAVTLAGGLWSRSPIGAAAALAAVAAALRAHDASCVRAEREALIREMPGVLRTVATALESGQTLVQAMDYVALHERGPAAPAFVRASLRLRCGMSVDEALEGLREELAAPGVELLSTALAVSQRTGSPLRDLLRSAALLVEGQADLERMLQVRTAQARLSVRVVCSLPAVMVLLLALISPDYQRGLTTGAGMGCICCAVVLDGVALMAIRKIMGGVLS